MRLVKLVVQRFQCIEAAEVEFGPHLNVLHGPNDLGKSSLAWAIRAVLLIPHGSVHATPFASWYDDGEPRVALTFCDDDGRYWRVTKTFGSGTAGRSTLESSKDGRSFTAEASARDVDRRVRELLRWGLAAPGTQGRQPVPESFLTQVLLADQSQDSVRKVLVDASLENDPDESGRARMNAALGALAQDPLFKQVLDQTTDWVDKAFTAKGNKKRAAGSPWVEVSERIKELRDQQAELEQKVKDSESVEARIRVIHAQRDALQSKVETDAEELRLARAALAVKQQRDDLERALREHEERLGSTANATNNIAMLDAQLAKLVELVEVARTQAEGTSTEAKRTEAELSSARTALDASVLDNQEAKQTEQALVAAKEAAEERVRNARTAVDDASEAALGARQAIEQRDQERAETERRKDRAGVAQAAANQAIGAVERAQGALEEAREQQRILRSDDRAQARELRRQELENQRLSLDARGGELEARRERAAAVGRQLQELARAQTAAQTAARELDGHRKAVGVEEAAIAKLATARQGLAMLDAYGRSREVRAQLNSAMQAADAAEQERIRANELRARAEALGADLRPDLPTAARLAELRALRDELRLAEARLGGGVSVTVRPRRSVAITASRDGSVQPPVDATTGATHTFAAARTLTLGLGDVADLEIVAGEEAARATAAELRARWVREGEATLVEHNAKSLDELASARTRADAAEAELSNCLRDAAIAEQRATGATGPDLAALRSQLADIDAELVGADREDLASRHARLGDPWQSGWRRLSNDLDDKVDSANAQLEHKRAAVTRAEAQLELLQAQANQLEAAAAEAQRQLAEPWATVVAATTAFLRALADERAGNEKALAVLATSASGEEASADQAVIDATNAFEAARIRAAQAQKDAQSADIAHAQATTRLEAAEAQAQGKDLALAASQLELARKEHDAASAAAAAAQAALDTHRDQRDESVRSQRRRMQDADLAHRTARDTAEAAATHLAELVATQQSKAEARAELRVKAASVNLDEMRRAIADTRAQLAALPPAVPGTDEASVARMDRMLADARALLREADVELQRSQGALEQVGGAIVRDRLDEVTKALERATEREREVEIEYGGWRLLQEALREAEQTESRHLGRSLAGPVSSRFRALTGGRYGDLELGPQLEAGGIQIAGDTREIGALSAGTQDQLATLLRVCIAQQLRSAIVLDDHLSQSDTSRIAWFNTMLREAAEQVQVVLITCRPDELLTSGDRTERVRATDLTTVIKRYAGPLRAAT